MPRITSYEYEFLKGDWPEGRDSASLKSVLSFCTYLGFCNERGRPTPLGRQVVQEYEDFYSTRLNAIK